MATGDAGPTDETRLHPLAEEQAALRRVATLVARGGEPEAVLRAVADEAGTLLGSDTAAIVRFEKDGTATVVGAHRTRRAHGTRFEPDPDYIVAAVRRTGRDARFDTDDPAAADMPEPVRAEGIRSGVASPIVVDGELWGTITLASLNRPLPARAERRLADFTELVAAAISNAQAREDLRRLADEQAALRRVATRVARGAAQAEVFAAVGEECGRLFGIVDVRLVRFEEGPSQVVLASSGRSAPNFPVGSHQPLEGDNTAARVHRTGRPARIDDYQATATGPIAEATRDSGLRSVVAVPIVVEGRLWGTLGVGSASEWLPPETESRLSEFTDLMATAVSNAESGARADRLAAEQTALHRVAMLVAEESPLDSVFATLVAEVAALAGGDGCALLKAEADGALVPLAVHGAELAGRATVGCPIVVRGRVWGTLRVAGEEGNAFAGGIGTWVARFAHLAATAVANAVARAEVERLADEQGALRRVATLVAGGASPTDVFDAVAAEMAALLGSDGVLLARYEAGDELTILAHRGPDWWKVPPGTRARHEQGTVGDQVRHTGRPAVSRNPAAGGGDIGQLAGELGIRTAVGAPIVVDGGLWGITVATWMNDEMPPPETERRMTQFAELLDTAIANADSHDQLTASRARLLTEADDARRRVARDLHDGAQQRLVHAIVSLRLAQASLRLGDGQTESLLTDALQHAQTSNEELRELAHGILPAALTHGGLQDGIDAVVSRLDVPVSLDIPARRLPEEIEANVYFIVAEALTNVVKHARATRAEVSAAVHAGTLRVEVRDDGIGGADKHGHGLVGIADRATALGGLLEVDSPDGGGTVLRVALPLPLPPAG